MDSMVSTPSTERRSSPLAGLRVTYTGILVMITAVLVAVASFTSEANLLLLLFGIAIGLILFNLHACMRMARGLDVERSLPGAAVAGRPMRIGYTIKSRRRWLRSWGLRIAEVPVPQPGPRFSPTFVPVVGPGEQLQVHSHSMCPDRGRVDLVGIRISCGFPFGLFDCHVDVEAPAELIVYPAVGRVRREFWHQHALSDTPASRRPDRRAGQDEFHGVREYRPGDNPRLIHWRRSARTGELVVREHQAIRDSHLMVLLDPWSSGSTHDSQRGFLERVFNHGHAVQRDPQVERIISAAATAICEALDRGHRVGIVGRAAVPIVLAPAGGRAHRQRLLHELALLSPGGERSLDQLIAGIRWSGNWGARCLLFASHGEEAHGRALRMLAGRSESVTLVTPQSGWLEKLFDLAPAGDDRRGAA